MSRAVLILIVLFSLKSTTLSSRTADSSGLRIKYLSCDTLGHREDMPEFGGISAMEWMPANRIFPGLSNKFSLLLFSDHSPNHGQPGIKQRSLVFQYLVSRNLLLKKFRPFDSGSKQVINCVEAVRYSKKLRKIFYSYESSGDPEKTGVVSLDEARNADTIISFDMPKEFENRGIEAIALSDDLSLWFVEESGTNNAINFGRIRYDVQTKKSIGDEPTLYAYSFNKCSCLSVEQCPGFNGRIGNGISEIQVLPEKLGGGFLVLERCFNDSASFAKLFHATIDNSKPKQLRKQLVFDFNAAGLNPDNLEGMAWGPGEKGKHILYLISDDNYNYKGRKPQHTVLFKLAVINDSIK